MSKISTFSVKGNKTQPIDLPKGLKSGVNMTLLAQAIRVYEDNTHPGLSKTKTRGEVVASKRKIYRQKGTGRARHGALSAPIFVGGGKAHGAKGGKRKLELPKKMRKRALLSAINLKLKNGEVSVVSGISALKKTKDAANLLEKIVKGKRCTVSLSEKNKEVAKFFRNIENVEVVRFSGLDVYQVYFAGYLIVDKDAFGELSEKDKKTVVEKDKKEGVAKKSK